MVSGAFLRYRRRLRPTPQMAGADAARIAYSAADTIGTSRT
jgi:hypothetical protein